MSARVWTLNAARKAVVQDRARAYGGPEQSFQQIADYWTIHVNKRLQILYGEADGNKGNQLPQLTLTGADVAIMMDLLKLARLGTNPEHLDSWVDVAGYAACGAEVSVGDIPAEVPEPSADVKDPMTEC